MLMTIIALIMKWQCSSKVYWRVLSLAMLALTIQSCGSGSGADTVQNQDTRQPEVNEFTYQGPAPQTSDIQNFRVSVYDKIVTDNRCGACHSSDQAPFFVDRSDVNRSYEQAIPLVDLSNPSASRLVTKVGGGHNCWVDTPSVCAEIMTNFIEAWAGASGESSNEINLTAPVIRDAGASKTLPADSSSFAATVHPILQTYCANCHSDTAAIQQQPLFASNNIDLAYDNAKSKIDVGSPANSRLVLRLRQEFHNCWDNCVSNADEMQAAIQALSDSIEITEIDPEFVVSKALSLSDGVIASSGGRVETNVIALYEFKTGEGSVAFDTSGVDPALNLGLTDGVEWIGSFGIRLNDGRAQGGTAASAKLHDLITSTGEYSIEAWLVPANVTQDGPARILTYSGNDESRNFTLGQTLYSYDYLNRNLATNTNGMPALSTNNADEVLQATLQHVVLTYNPIDGSRIYVNGELVADAQGENADSLNNWDPSFALALGAEVSGRTPWQGSVRLLAIYNRAISEDAIQANLEAGVGEKYFLLFNISDSIDIDNAYVVFEVQQFDDYSYLFNSPFFFLIGTDPSEVSGIDLQGMRIGINGREAEQGQAFATLNTQLDGSRYGEQGQVLSDRGTIVPLDQGPEVDQFFLTFEKLGTESYVRLDTSVLVEESPVDIESPLIGLRMFAEINASLSALTDIPTDNVAVSSTFDRIQQQLPTSTDINGFLASHQMGITQLAVEYCNELTSDANNGRALYFPNLDFTQPADIALSAANRGGLIEPMMDRLLVNEVGNQGTLDTQPDVLQISGELGNLTDRMLASCGANCDATNTRTISTAVCSAAMASALMLLQ